MTAAGLDVELREALAALSDPDADWRAAVTAAAGSRAAVMEGRGSRGLRDALDGMTAACAPDGTRRRAWAAVYQAWAARSYGLPPDPAVLPQPADG